MSFVEQIKNIRILLYFSNKHSIRLILLRQINRECFFHENNNEFYFFILAYKSMSIKLLYCSQLFGIKGIP
jgi:hypothetical protein